MQSHLSGLAPPYRLPCDTMYFHDWRYVCHGTPNAFWKTESGEHLPLFSPSPVPVMRYEYAFDSQPGLRLKALLPEKSDPVISPDNSPFPFYLMPGNLMKEDGLTCGACVPLSKPCTSSRWRSARGPSTCAFARVAPAASATKAARTLIVRTGFMY